MGERPSEYERDEHDWYVEPEWAARAIFEKVAFQGAIHDPCCGMGTIVKAAKPHRSHGADIVDRGYGFPVRDYLKNTSLYDNIVTNPPYNIAQDIIEHALLRVRYRVAVLTQLKFLSSQGRYKLFNNSWMEKVIIFSRRPSMPPGVMLQKHGEAIRGGGSIDYCWLVWNKTHPNQSTVTTEWII
jgi:hypothetical protein